MYRYDNYKIQIDKISRKVKIFEIGEDNKEYEQIETYFLNADSICKELYNIINGSIENSSKYKSSIANKILNNTISKELQNFIKEYISIVERTYIENDDMFEDDIIRFNKCVEYIIEKNFDVSEWGLWEIPIYYAHCFFNDKEEQVKMFDLDVYELDGNVIPTYLDKDCNENSAITIEEAIDKYKDYLELYK
ncbi:hypothetical protein [Clostridium butyricum]|uniref:hypothetical protein n=1 Tax=Clostridium butyricum TaxID=1492 RepID=UPI002AB039A8|nr:hypothetical protein [Clostridium butyricum]